MSIDTMLARIYLLSSNAGESYFKISQTFLQKNPRVVKKEQFLEALIIRAAYMAEEVQEALASPIPPDQTALQAREEKVRMAVDEACEGYRELMRMAGVTDYPDCFTPKPIRVEEPHVPDQ